MHAHTVYLQNGKANFVAHCSLWQASWQYSKIDAANLWAVLIPPRAINTMTFFPLNLNHQKVVLF
jgi:hypothetical protein